MTLANVKKHLRQEGFHISKTDVKEHQYRFRQFDPDICEQGTFRTIFLGGHEQGVVCKPKGSNKTKLQTIIVKK